MQGVRATERVVTDVVGKGNSPPQATSLPTRACSRSPDAPDLSPAGTRAARRGNTERRG
jgi:hypothetical protein